jgi:DNA-binding transcriptional regulator GbsR (MarR family)
MQIDEGKRKFINAWGNLGSNWGISRTMAQIHALLLISREPLCADTLMEELKISRGNVNMSLRGLMDWGIVHKDCKPGVRKEYFCAEKDFWRAFRQIIKKRKAKELDPMIDVLTQISAVQGQCPDTEEFCKMVRELKSFSETADEALEMMIQSDKNWLMSPYFKMLK